MTGAASRRKGVAGEREVADVFEAAGHQLRGLEASGDWLCIDPRHAAAPLLHVEVKRQERLRMPEWVRQAKQDAPRGAVPLVAYRQNRGEWRVDIALADLLRMMR